MYSASDRYRLQMAPGGLAFVQDFVNTASAGRTVRGADLLDDVAHANEWIASAWRDGGDPENTPVIGERDLESLRRLRTELVDSFTREAGEIPTTPARTSIRADLTLTPQGVLLQPSGSGYRLIAGELLSALFRSQVEGVSKRLKICPNEWCGVAFFDRSKNVSAVWHSAASCGNLANVRASRQRKRSDEHATLSAG